MIQKRLIDFFDKYKILNENQFGFRKKFSTNLSLLDLNEQLLQNKETGRSTVLVFLDRKKAFDSVNHLILIKKLKHSGIRGQALQLLSLYLADRERYVEIGDLQSEKLTISCGVPQVSVLALYCSCYMSTICQKNIIISTKLFADDTVIYRADKCMIKLQTVINRELNCLNCKQVFHKYSKNSIYGSFCNSKKFRFY